MCGIIGYLRSSPVSIESFVSYRDRMTHRGPDDAGIWQNDDGTVLLGHRRLSILDLSPAGHQPVVSDCGRFIIVFNGEIYNYLELKVELGTLGHRFKGSGDTEVVLAAYRQWGDGCLSRFNGMFAIAVWDQGTADTLPSLFIARDRVGKKPLYYAHSGGMLSFASELKAIPREMILGIDYNALNYYLAMGYVPASLCIAGGVNKLPPAHAAMYVPDRNELKTWRWWSLPTGLNVSHSFTGEEFAEQSWDLLTNAVKCRLRSDVPIGVFLSGGLDSSLITAAAATVTSQPINTFTVGVPGSMLDESHHARMISDHFSTRHQLLELHKPSLEILDELSSFIDEPIADSSILPTYMISKLTSQHVKVALGGDGGDELYGGYSYYQNALRDRYRFGWLPNGLLRFIAGSAAKLPAGIHGRNRLASLRGGSDQAHIWGTPYFDINLRRRILHQEIIDDLGDKIDAPEHYLLGLMRQSEHGVDGLMRTDFQSILPDNYLVKVDRASMANSLEVRTPFLDYRIVEHAFGAVPADWKVTLKERRRIQNLMAKSHLPNNYTLGRKQGFSVPMEEWLRQSDINAYLESLPSDLINHSQVVALVRGQRIGRANGSRLFALMMFAFTIKNMNREAS